MPIKFTDGQGKKLPWQLPISNKDRLKGRTEEKDASIDACWVGDRYQKMSPEVAGQVLKWRLQQQQAKAAEDREAAKAAALEKIAEEAVAKAEAAVEVPPGGSPMEAPAPMKSKSQTKRVKAQKESTDA